jgi:uncharacterized membrane protein
MKSTAHLNGHPIHPMLIPYPFALLSSAVVFDLVGRATRGASLSATAKHLNAAGLATAVVAAVPGVIDYFGSIPPRTRARSDATKHALVNVSALACFALAHSRRRADGRIATDGLVLGLLGTGMLSLGGWLGGELVYHEHIGVVDEGDEPVAHVLPGPPPALVDDAPNA